MKKNLIFVFSILLAIILGISLLTSCNGNGSKPKTIIFWTHYTDDIEFTREKVAEYNLLMKGEVVIELKHIQENYINTLLTALEQGAGPDIFADSIELAQLVEYNYAAPLDDFMSDETKEKVAPFIGRGSNWLDGTWYSMPFRGYNFRLAINEDLFQAAGLDPNFPPKNYAEFREYAKIISDYGKTLDEPKYGFMLPTGEEWIWWIYASQPARANGKNNFDFTTGKYTWEAYEEVLELYLGMKEDNSLFPSGTNINNDDAREQFSLGNVGMIFAASWDIGVFNEQFPATINWSVTKIPSYDGNFHGYTQLDAGSYLYINSASDYKREAMAFYEYLLSDEILVEYYEKGYGIPVYDHITELVDNIPQKPGFEGFADVSGDKVYLFEPPVRVEGFEYGFVLNQIMCGEITIDEGIEDLNFRYNEALEKHVNEGLFDIDDYIFPKFSTKNPIG